MYIIIAGCFKIGATLAMQLSQQDHDVVVIDSDPKNLEALGSGFNGVTITGMPIDEDVLRSAGIEKADALAAVTRDDNMNLMVAQIAATLFHVPRVITRLYAPEQESVFRELGMTTVCPTSLAVDAIREMLLPQERTVSIRLAGAQVHLRTVEPNRRLLGKRISDSKEIDILGIIRHGHFIHRQADTEVEPGDLLVLTAVDTQGDMDI